MSLRSKECGGKTRIQELLMRYDCLASLAVLILASFFTFLFFWPGYFQADHQTVIARIAAGIPRQQHSLTWGYTFFPLIYLSPHYSLYGIAQLGVFTVCVYACAQRLKRLGIVRLSLPLCTFYALFPTYLLYNELWGTDLCFAYALMVMTSLLVELCMYGEKALEDRSFCIRFALTILITTLLRKNAILISICLCPMLPLAYREMSRRAFAVCVLPTALALIVDGWLFPVAFGATPSASSEFLSVPSQQIARVYATGGEVPDDIDAVFTQDRTADEWATCYASYIADPAKLGRQLTPEFIIAWARLGLLHPDIYLDAYTDLMYPLWTFGKVEGYRYGIGFITDFGMWEDFTLRYAEDGLREGYLREFDGEQAKSRQWLMPRRAERLVEQHCPLLLRWVFYDVLFNRGLPFWLLVAGFILAACRRDYLLISFPCLCVLLTLLVFAPVASFRYLLGCYYALPIVFLALIRHLGLRFGTHERLATA